MARVLSAVVLLPLVIGVIWFLPPLATLLMVEVVAFLAYREYVALASGFGASLFRGFTLIGVGATVAAAPYGMVVFVLISTSLVLAAASLATGRSGGKTLLDIASSMFALLYLGLPLGTLVAVNALAGREAVVLLLATIMVSDTAQYYGGRSFGRTPLSPAISPNKAVEGALCGAAAGVGLLSVYAPLALGLSSVFQRVLLGVVIVTLGVVGDLFESQLKRGAGVKDASALIPGHGGILDRIDSLLFAAPGFYLFLQFG